MVLPYKGVRMLEEDQTEEEVTNTATEGKKPFGEDLLLITDANISEEIYGSYQGFKFNCPVCHLPSIMVNDDMVVKGVGICLKCHRKVLIRSAIVDRNRSLQTDNAVK